MTEEESKEDPFELIYDLRECFMIDETWPRQSSTQIDLSLHLSTCVDNRAGSSNMDTGVVPVTTSPTPKLERMGRYSKRKLAELSQSIFLVPFVDNVKVLYKLLWILAIVEDRKSTRLNSSHRR